MFCPNCGIEIRDDSSFCYKCGKAVGGKAAETPPAAAENAEAAPRTVPSDHNVIISCISGHEKAYTEVQAGGMTVKIVSGHSAKLLLPLGTNKIHFFTRRYGMTWVRTKNRYERDLVVEPGRLYQIDVKIGQSTNQIEIMGY